MYSRFNWVWASDELRPRPTSLFSHPRSIWPCESCCPRSQRQTLWLARARELSPLPSGCPCPGAPLRRVPRRVLARTWALQETSVLPSSSHLTPSLKLHPATPPKPVRLWWRSRCWASPFELFAPWGWQRDVERCTFPALLADAWPLLEGRAPPLTASPSLAWPALLRAFWSRPRVFPCTHPRRCGALKWAGSFPSLFSRESLFLFGWAPLGRSRLSELLAGFLRA